MKSVRLISFTCELLVLNMNNNPNFMRIYIYILNIYPFGDRQTVGEHMIFLPPYVKQKSFIGKFLILVQRRKNKRCKYAQKTANLLVDF